jgi:hypothetical protein
MNGVVAAIGRHLLFPAQLARAVGQSRPILLVRASSASIRQFTFVQSVCNFLYRRIVPFEAAFAEFIDRRPRPLTASQSEVQYRGNLAAAAKPIKLG